MWYIYICDIYIYIYVFCSSWAVRIYHHVSWKYSMLPNLSMLWPSIGASLRFMMLSRHLWQRLKLVGAWFRRPVFLNMGGFSMLFRWCRAVLAILVFFFKWNLMNHQFLGNLMMNHQFSLLSPPYFWFRHNPATWWPWWLTKPGVCLATSRASRSWAIIVIIYRIFHIVIYHGLWHIIVI